MKHLSILVMLGIIFVSSVQPMIMVASLILMVVLYSFMIYMNLGGYWFSYALVMVMLSGVLVVFTYMVSLIPNESFESVNLIYIFLFMLFVSSGYMLVYSLDESWVSLGLWSKYVGIFNMFVISFLLSIMLMVVWFSCLDKGALRVSCFSAWMKG